MARKHQTLYGINRKHALRIGQSATRHVPPRPGYAKGTTLDAVDRLIAIESIKALKARYFRLVDTKAWDALAELFTPGALLSFPEALGEPYDLIQFIELLRSAYDRCVTIHHGHMPEIEIEEPNRATAIWAMTDARYFPLDEERAPAATLIGAGHYHESYIRCDGRWLIDRLSLTRLRLVSHARPLAF